jgi:hypothetical protein
MHERLVSDRKADVRQRRQVRQLIATTTGHSRILSCVTPRIEIGHGLDATLDNRLRAWITMWVDTANQIQPERSWTRTLQADVETKTFRPKFVRSYYFWPIHWAFRAVALKEIINHNFCLLCMLTIRSVILTMFIKELRLKCSVHFPCIAPQFGVVRSCCLRGGAKR